MAIINTFEKCLESPYLFVDADAPARVESLVTQAQTQLGLAEEVAQKSSDSVEVSYLSHQAMFCCLRAMVYAKGYREAGLKCLLSAVFSLYIKPGLLDAKVLSSFEAAQSLKASPEENLREAQSLLEATRTLLGRA